jgi:hypothetical protein
MMVNCSELWGRSGAIYQLASQSLSICMCHRKGRTTFAAQGKLAMAVFFVALKRARMPGWLQGKKQVWSAPGSLMMKVHRFDLAHPWNRHNWTYIPFPDTPYIYIYIHLYILYMYIYIIISYNFDVMTFAERTYVPTSNAYNHTHSVRPLPPAPVPKNFLPRLRGKARFGVFWSKVGLRWTRRDQ